MIKARKATSLTWFKNNYWRLGLTAYLAFWASCGLNHGAFPNFSMAVSLAVVLGVSAFFGYMAGRCDR